MEQHENNVHDSAAQRRAHLIAKCPEEGHSCQEGEYNLLRDDRNVRGVIVKEANKVPYVLCRSPVNNAARQTELFLQNSVTTQDPHRRDHRHSPYCLYLVVGYGPCSLVPLCNNQLAFSGTRDCPAAAAVQDPLN